MCATATLAGPSRQNPARHSPIVCRSRSSAPATAAAVQPRASSHSACQRSRSRGVGARYTSVRTAARSIPQRANATVNACESSSFTTTAALHGACHAAVSVAGFTLALV